MVRTGALTAVALLTGAVDCASAVTTQPVSPSGDVVIAAADGVRNPSAPFRVTLTLVEYNNNRPETRTVLVIYAKENSATRQFDNLVRYAEPHRDTGKLVLFTASSLWFFDPASQASIRISPEQRLSGQASDGDVLTVNLTRDFTARVVGIETLRDADHQERECWRLGMTAATPEAIYDRIEYWVERGTFRPIKAKFYADSGRLLKIAYYHKYKEQLGASRPTEVILIDAVNPNLATTIGYSDYRFQRIPEAWFQRDYLPRLKPE